MVAHGVCQIALFVISAAGLGRRASWKDDLVIPSGHSMTFRDALHIASNDVLLKLVCFTCLRYQFTVILDM